LVREPKATEPCQVTLVGEGQKGEKARNGGRRTGGAYHVAREFCAF